MSKTRFKLLLKKLVRAWKKGNTDKENKVCEQLCNDLSLSQSDYDIIFYGTGEQIIDLLKARKGI